MFNVRPQIYHAFAERELVTKIYNDYTNRVEMESAIRKDKNSILNWLQWLTSFPMPVKEAFNVR